MAPNDQIPWSIIIVIVVIIAVIVGLARAFSKKPKTTPASSGGTPSTRNSGAPELHAPHSPAGQVETRSSPTTPYDH